VNGSVNTNSDHENRIAKATLSGSELDEARNARFGAGSNVSMSTLGEPLSIREVATMLGCSPWTVRQKYLPQGLPHLRTSAGGRLVFFRLQVIRWILKRQEIHTKGGVKK